MKERLEWGFFARKPEVVARELLGKLLVRVDGKDIKVGIITETEAYLGVGDKACHSHRGMTKRNEVMFGPAGVAYVYFTYGMHWLLNFITEEEGKPSGVLIRALEPVLNSELETQNSKFLNGPARLTKWMNIDGDLNREDITRSNKLFVTEGIKIGNNVYKARKVKSGEIISAPRIGIDYAGEHKDLKLRFYIN